MWGGVNLLAASLEDRCSEAGTEGSTGRER